jgi:NAD+ diphosphatase
VKPYQTFNFCPSCGKEQPTPQQPCFVCKACKHTYFFNPTIAAAGLVLNKEGQMLFIERAKEPAKGKLAFVGGFIDAGEIAEQALEREIEEEVGLKVGNIKYVGSFPNTYRYKNIDYPVLDFFYSATCSNTHAQLDQSEVTKLHWLTPREVDADELAFDSMKQAFKLWMKLNQPR